MRIVSLLAVLLLVIAGSVILPAASVAVADDDAKSILEAASDRMAALKSVSMLQNSHIRVAGVGVDMDMQVSEERPGKSYVLITSRNTRVEVVQNGETLYARTNGRAWVQTTLEEAGINPNAFTNVSMTDRLSAIQRFGDTTFRGVEVYHLRGSIDFEVAERFLKGLYTQGAISEVADRTEITFFSVDYYIGIEDKLIRNVKMTMTYQVAGVPASMRGEIIYSGFNEPLRLPAGLP